MVGENVGLPYEFAGGHRTRYLGGSSNCWGGWCRPWTEHEFLRRSWVPDSDWPIRFKDVEPYYAAAREFARIVAEHSLHQQPQDRLFICTGGGPGVMEAANRGAHDVGVPSVGLNIGLPHEQQTNPYVTPYLAFKFHYFALRKMHFMMRAKALVAFPGGFGTLDELFEVLTLVQTRKVRRVPIVLFGKSYWSRLLNLEMLVEEGAIASEDLQLYQLVDEPAQAWKVIQQFYGL